MRCCTTVMRWKSLSSVLPLMSMYARLSAQSQPPVSEPSGARNGREAATRLVSSRRQSPWLVRGRATVSYTGPFPADELCMMIRAGTYAGLIAGNFRNARIVYARAGGTMYLPDSSSLYLTEFGVVVQTPAGSPDKFIPWASILEIEECAAPGREIDDGQMHD